jgi:hypothetical protein
MIMVSLRRADRPRVSVGGAAARRPYNCKAGPRAGNAGLERNRPDFPCTGDPVTVPPSGPTGEAGETLTVVSVATP